VGKGGCCKLTHAATGDHNPMVIQSPMILRVITCLYMRSDLFVYGDLKTGIVTRGVCEGYLSLFYRRVFISGK
jgi:hypothetical protein